MVQRARLHDSRYATDQGQGDGQRDMTLIHLALLYAHDEKNQEQSAKQRLRITDGKNSVAHDLGAQPFTPHWRFKGPLVGKKEKNFPIQNSMEKSCNISFCSHVPSVVLWSDARCINVKSKNSLSIIFSIFFVIRGFLEMTLIHLAHL